MERVILIGLFLKDFLGFLKGDDSVVECVREHGNKINAYVSWNLVHDNKREVRGDWTNDLVELFSCFFFI